MRRLMQINAEISIFGTSESTSYSDNNRKLLIRSLRCDAALISYRIFSVFKGNWDVKCLLKMRDTGIGVRRFKLDLARDRRVFKS